MDVINVLTANTLSVVFSKEVYCCEALMAAAYRQTEKYGVEIRTEDENYLVVLTPRAGYSPDEAAQIEGLLTFRNDVLDEELRIKLHKKTSKLQELIVQHAFSPIDLRKEVETDVQ